jgi:hypothetical protein
MGRSDCQTPGLRRTRRRSGSYDRWMPDWVAIAIVAATAAVAIWTPIITAKREERRLRLQVDEARVDELPSVLTRRRWWCGTH